MMTVLILVTRVAVVLTAASWGWVMWHRRAPAGKLIGDDENRFDVLGRRVRCGGRSGARRVAGRADRRGRLRARGGREAPAARGTRPAVVADRRQRIGHGGARMGARPRGERVGRRLAVRRAGRLHGPAAAEDPA